jgi:hypothetical protein
MVASFNLDSIVSAYAADQIISVATAQAADKDVDGIRDDVRAHVIR